MKVSVFSFLLSIFRSRRFRWTIRILALAAIFSGVAAVLFPQKVLTIESGPTHGDVIVILGGAPHDRAVRAAELFKEGVAPRIIVSGTGDDRRNEQLLTQAGVPTNAIQIESESFTTRENALFTIPLLRKLGVKRVIIVTSWFHSRRALHTFEHYAPDIQFFSRPSYYGYPGTPPTAARSTSSVVQRSSGPVVPNTAPVSPYHPRSDWKAMRGYVKSEYVKLLGYWFYYGVCPL